jgi:hypothetical protein
MFCLYLPSVERSGKNESYQLDYVLNTTLSNVHHKGYIRQIKGHFEVLHSVHSHVIIHLFKYTSQMRHIVTELAQSTKVTADHSQLYTYM